MVMGEEGIKKSHNSRWQRPRSEDAITWAVEHRWRDARGPVEKRRGRRTVECEMCTRPLAPGSVYQRALVWSLPFLQTCHNATTAFSGKTNDVCLVLLGLPELLLFSEGPWLLYHFIAGSENLPPEPCLSSV